MNSEGPAKEETMTSSIVIVEDEPTIAELLQLTLVDLGYSVGGIAETGADAVELVAATTPDLVLMDIQLNGQMDGIDAAERILEEHKIPLIFLTAFSDPLTIARARNVSPYGYVVKPFQIGELHAAIETTLHRAELDAKRQSEERQLAATLASMGDAVVTTDVHGQITFFNPVAEALTGWAAGEAIGQPVQQVVVVLDAEGNTARTHPARQVLSEGSPISLAPYGQLLQRSGRVVPISDNAAPIRDDQGGITGVVLVFRDTSVQRSVQQQLQFAAMHDALTRLPNRSLLYDRLRVAHTETCRHQERNFAVLFVDLDHFKLINDSLGHLVGDRLLVEVAARLTACTRAYDTVARMGGDEFVLLLTSVLHREEALGVAERIHYAMRTPFLIDGHELYCTASIGVRLSQSNDVSIESILRDADAALYRAKALGRNQYVVFEPAMHEEVLARLSLETDLRHAWNERQFSLVYQPIQALDSGRLYGLEALVRWEHPLRGRVGPGQFVPVLEETGLIIEVGGWVIEQSCRQLAQLRHDGLIEDTAIMSVNLSVRQLYHPRFVESVGEALNQTGLPAHLLHLEITESIMLADSHIRQTLHGLRELGVGLSLDDFGTGYSSLSALHELPIGMVKIDRAFVQAFEQPDRRRSMVRAILHLAHELALEVVAEGIETRAQLTALRSVGCSYGQGYLFAHPMDAEELHTWLAGAQKRLELGLLQALD
jgi:diguanylate cyclase (GGDEF)-like protein/PAS domain S-box-containing protein